MKEHYYGNREYKLLLSTKSYVQSSDTKKLIPYNSQDTGSIQKTGSIQDLGSIQLDSFSIKTRVEPDIQVEMDGGIIEQHFLKKIRSNDTNYHEFNNRLNNKLNSAYDLYKIQNQQNINHCIRNNVKFHYNSKKRQHNLDKKLQKRVTQLMFRLNEGKGKALYIIGITDDGNSIGLSLEQIFESVHYLDNMIKIINATVQYYRIYLGKNGFVLTTRITLLPFKEIEYFA